MVSKTSANREFSESRLMTMKVFEVKQQLSKQGVRRKNLLDTMLFFSIKDPQDPPSLPPPA